MADRTLSWRKTVRPQVRAEHPDMIALVTEREEIRMPVSEAELLATELMALLGWKRATDGAG